MGGIGLIKRVAQNSMVKHVIFIRRISKQSFYITTKMRESVQCNSDSDALCVQSDMI